MRTCTFVKFAALLLATAEFTSTFYSFKVRGVGRGGHGGGGMAPPIKSGQGAKKGHIFWPYLAYPLLTNISC